MKTLALEGALTEFAAAKQMAKLLDFLYSGDKLEINLANVTEIDMAGLQLLILIKRQAEQEGTTLYFVMYSKAVLEILKLSGLTRTFDSLR